MFVKRNAMCLCVYFTTDRDYFGRPCISSTLRFAQNTLLFFSNRNYCCNPRLSPRSSAKRRVVLIFSLLASRTTDTRIKNERTSYFYIYSNTCVSARTCKIVFTQCVRSNHRDDDLSTTRCKTFVRSHFRI